MPTFGLSSAVLLAAVLLATVLLATMLTAMLATVLGAVAAVAVRLRLAGTIKVEKVASMATWARAAVSNRRTNLVKQHTVLARENRQAEAYHSCTRCTGKETSASEGRTRPVRVAVAGLRA
jgi:hypothetical protein